MRNFSFLDNFEGFLIISRENGLVFTKKCQNFIFFDLFLALLSKFDPTEAGRGLFGVRGTRGYLKRGAKS